jgi:dephospho-CoA kinase
MIIIGITGTLGAGKGTIVDFLTKKEDFEHYSVRNYLLVEMKRLGMPENRDSMTSLANKLRAAFGPSYIIDKLYEKALSIRTPGEILSLKRKSDFYLLAVDAKQKTRFNRIKKRGSETDRVSFKEFAANEIREMESDDPHKQNLSKCIEMADYNFQNDSGVKDLLKKVKAAIDEIKKIVEDDKRKD